MESSSQTSCERLARLIESGRCPPSDAPEYATELKRVAEEAMDIEVIKRQSRVFRALADGTRLRILKLLQVREMCVCEVMVALDLTQPTASHHLRILEDADLVDGEKKGKWVFYRITNRRLIQQLDKLSPP